MLWIPITVGAAGLQVARNAFQRGLLTDAGPWGATLVRFLFGLPFAALFLAIAAVVAAPVAPRFGGGFWLACAAGAAAQMVATAAMLVSMRRSSFALGTVFQQSSIPLAGLFGLAFGEPLPALKWLGLALVTAGLVALGWPRPLENSPTRRKPPAGAAETAAGAPAGERVVSAALLGLVAGAGFALSSNAFRQAALAFDAHAPVFAALATVLAAQAMQSAALAGWLAARNPVALVTVVSRWRESLPAGFFGAAASGLWFTAFALSPAGPVRAVGVVEMPIAAIAGRRLFAERLASWQILLLVQIAAGVCLAAVG
jgi:drug/metabolite transporter (DMT)-like permease